MDFKYIAMAEQTLDALNDAVNVLEQKEKIRANIDLYNYSLFELNRAKDQNEVTYIFSEKRFGRGRNFGLNHMAKYQRMARYDK